MRTQIEIGGLVGEVDLEHRPERPHERGLPDLAWPQGLHVEWRRKLRAAYAHEGYAEAKRALLRLVSELATLNESAARSLEEGLDETLTLHRLGVHEDLRRSLHTTNLIESVMAQIERKTQRAEHQTLHHRRRCVQRFSGTHLNFN